MSNFQFLVKNKTKTKVEVTYTQVKKVIIDNELQLANKTVTFLLEKGGTLVLNDVKEETQVHVRQKNGKAVQGGVEITYGSQMSPFSMSFDSKGGPGDGEKSEDSNEGGD